MHRALLIHEIVDRVLEDLLGVDLIFSWRGDQTVVSLALTCKTLCEPALDKLWKKLPNPIPLIQCWGDAVNFSGGQVVFSDVDDSSNDERYVVSSMCQGKIQW